MYRVIWAVLIGAGLAFIGRASYQASAQPGGKQVDTQVYEMRTYHIMPGKAQALHARFRNHTNKLLQKHGMKLVAFWSPLDSKDAEQKLIWIVAHPSREAAQKSWAAFSADPDWQKAKADSEKDGKLVERVESVFMSLTDYSPAIK